MALPIVQLREVVSSVLRWEMPGLSAAFLSVVQSLTLTERLRYLPPLFVLALAGHIWLLRRRTVARQASGGADSSSRHTYRIDYRFEDGTLRTKLRLLNDGAIKLDHAVERVLVGLLKLHSAYAGVDERITDRFILGLVVLSCAIAVLLWAISWVPLWLAQSVVLSGMFVAWHPSVAQDGGDESSWVAHGAGALHTQLTVLSVGAALLPILWVAPDRAMTSSVIFALLGALVALARRRSTGGEVEPAATPRTPRSPTPRRPAT